MNKKQIELINDKKIKASSLITVALLAIRSRDD